MRVFHDRSQPRRGTALFIVTIVVVLISLSAYGFVVLMQAENRAAHLSADRTQVQRVAESAFEYLQALLAMSRAERDLRGGWHNNAESFRDIVVDQDPFGQRHGRFCVVSPRYLEGELSQSFQFGVESTSAKLSLTALLNWDEIEPGSARLALMRLPGMSESVADSILDWIDADDIAREFGAESEFYLGLDPPRKPLNRVPRYLDQLLAVRGVRETDLLGTGIETAVIGVAVEQDMPATPTPSPVGITAFDAGAVERRPWSHYLTVHSAERNEDYDGFPRINLNQQDLAALHTQLSNRFSRQVADFVVALRQYGPRQEQASALSASELPTVSLTASPAFELTSPLDVVDALVGIPDGTEEEELKVVRSPISKESSSDLSLVDFCDQTTTSAEPTIFGRVDVNQAPREVLEAIPNFPAEAVEQLLSMRVSTTEALPDRKHATWLLVEGIVDRATMRQLMPFVTTAGDVIQGEIVAYYDQASPWARHEFVLDGTREEIPALLFRDLGRLGRGYQYSELSLEAELGDMGTTTASARPTRQRPASSPPLPSRPVRSTAR